MGEPQYPAPPVASEPVDLGVQDTAAAVEVAKALPDVPAEGPPQQPPAEQPAEVPDVLPPAEFEEPVAEQPVFVPEPAVQQPALGAQEAGVVRTASNVSPVLPANAQAAVARAHALLSHFEQVIHAARADLEKYVPHGFKQAAADEVALFVRSLL